MQSPTARRSLIPRVVGLGLIVTGAMGYSLLTGSRMAARHAPLADAAMEIKLEAALGHLWFQEGITAGRSEDVATGLEHLEQSAWYARAMLEGGENPEGVFIPLRDPVLRREIEDVLTKIEEFRASAQRRWAAAEQSGVGSATDERFDALFKDLLDQADKTETELQGAMARDLHRFRTTQGLLIVLCLGLSALIGIVFRRYERWQAFDISALRKSKEDLSITLDSIGDAVIVADDEGCVTRMNPVAEALTGWTDAEARGRSLNEVFHIINAQTREEAESPETKVFREGVVVGLANHTVLVARDGTERPIADCGSPIRDADGAVIGIVLVFRDVTESYAKDQRLRESEERYRAVAEDAPVLICRFLPGGEITYVNEAYCKYWERTSEKLVGSSFLSLIPEDGRASLMAKISALTVDEPTQSNEHPVIAPNGEVHWQHWTHRALFDAEGKAVAYQSVGEDITERRRAEKERELLLHDLGERVKELQCMYGVAESIRKRETLKGVFEEVVALIPPGWQYPEITRCRIRFNDEEFVSQQFEETEWRQSADIVIAGEQRGAIEVFYLEECPEQDEGPFLKEERDLVDGIARALGEAVEHDQVELARKRLMMAIEQGTEAVVITAADGTIQYVNPAFEYSSGYTREEAVGQTPRILKSGEQDDAFYRQMWEMLNRGETWNGRLVNKKKDGTLYTEEGAISPVRDDSGKTVNYVAIRHDITEKLSLEEQYRQAQKVESIGRLAGGVAHDLNNLLFPILAYSQMLLDDLESDDDARRQSLNEILRAGLRARDLVGQLLAFGRKQSLEYRPVDLNEAVAGFEELLRRTIREDIAIEIIPSPDVRTVMADIGQIEQVIMNLAVNAQDAMPEGGRLTIETATVELGEKYEAERRGVNPGAYVMLSVSDTGGGMDAATREQAFEPFFSTKGEQGTGMGLATVYGIVNQHGGNVCVSSAPGEGTTFKVYLPVSEGAHIEEKPSKKAVTDLRGSETILLAEDDEQVRHLARTILERQGYTVLAAASGPEALVILASHQGPVQLLLTDVIMPEMNGRELCEKASEAHPDLKVLYMSGYAADVVAHRGVLREGIAFIQKPFTVETLATKIREVLEEE